MPVSLGLGISQGTTITGFYQYHTESSVSM